MRSVSHCSKLALLLAVFVVPRIGSAQAAVLSDTLGESIVDEHPALGGVLPLTPPIFIPEGTGETIDKVFPFTGHEINFLELGATNSQFSDRLSISPYQVHIVSDDNPNGLPPRTNDPNVVRIPASALESFSPFVIVAHSDGEFLTGTVQESDRLTITLGSYGPGTGAKVFDDFIFEPLPEGVTEPILGFVIPATRFDVIEPPGEVAGAQGIVSDYVDISEIAVHFISTDDPAIIANLPTADGFVIENIELGGGVSVSLNFTSDAVPEPASLALIGIGLAAVAFIGRRHRRK